MCTTFFCFPKLNVAFHLAGPQAPRAYISGLGSAIQNDPHLLDIGSPDPAGFLVGMADVVTGNYAFMTNCAIFGHLEHLLLQPTA